MNKTVRVIRIGIPVLAAGVFCLWLLRQQAVFAPGTCFALISLCLFTCALTFGLIQLLQGRFETASPLSLVSDTRQDRLAAWGWLLLFGVAVSLIQYVAIYLIAKPAVDFMHSFRHLYYRSDVAHYMGIAQHGYVPEGDARLRLVFLPLYPLFVRTLTWNGDYFFGAFLASQLFSLCCLPAAYELFRLDMDRFHAMGCARVLFLLPGAAFLRVPMSESLFLFLTLTAVYLGRKRRFLLAGLFTALSALTRSLGILLMGLLAMEMLYAFRETYQEDPKQAFRLLPGYAGSLLLCLSGTLIYLWINWSVTGSPLTFLTYQRENWNQQLGLFFNTASYQIEYALTYWKAGDYQSIVSLSLPNLICSFGTLLLLVADRKQLRVSYLLWALLYYAVSIGATWLLSGPRYLAMLFPLAISICRPLRHRIAKVGLEALLLCGQTIYLLLLALDWFVY